MWLDPLNHPPKRLWFRRPDLQQHSELPCGLIEAQSATMGGGDAPGNGKAQRRDPNPGAHHRTARRDLISGTPVENRDKAVLEP